MLLVDSSVSIESLRDNRGRARDVLAALSDELVVTEPVLGELLAGARDPDLVEARLAALPIQRILL